ncbi:MAG TPA: rhodanese-like domain-containing protein, partial [Gemmatimonadaceae bacterium]|nr:rhodanese-like domain-containing protein [Gemmatimonadaceae bacterium]
ARAQAPVAEVTPAELAERRARGDDLDLIDVREPHEWEISRLPGARLIPLGTLEGALDTLDPDREVVVYCRGGTRSATAARLLHDAGFPRVSSLSGGILRWADEVGGGVRKY